MKEIITGNRPELSDLELDQVTGGGSLYSGTDQRVKVYSWFTNTSRLVASLPNGTKVRETGNRSEDRSWVEIDYPVMGWVQASQFIQ